MISKDSENQITETQKPQIRTSREFLIARSRNKVVLKKSKKIAHRIRSKLLKLFCKQKKMAMNKHI
jgi:hypothetical protein